MKRKKEKEHLNYSILYQCACSTECKHCYPLCDKSFDSANFTQQSEKLYKAA